MSSSLRTRLRSAVEVFAYSGLWTGAAAGVLCWAVGLALTGGISSSGLGPVCALATAGTIVVYSLDRLRDRDRDAANSPARTTFVSDNRAALVALIAGAASTSLFVASTLPISAWALCGAVLILGLLHRRLKADPRCARGYVTASWVAIAVGLPALVVAPAIDPMILIGIGVGIGLAITSNAIASELRGVRFDARAALQLRSARRAALASCAVCLAASGLRPLALIGAATWLSVLFFKADERYGLLALDGALLIGGIGAALSLRASIG